MALAETDSGTSVDSRCRSPAGVAAKDVPARLVLPSATPAVDAGRGVAGYNYWRNCNKTGGIK